jgi:hypothetical protein
MIFDFAFFQQVEDILNPSFNFEVEEVEICEEGFFDL